jgi:4-hydroxyacetophenone monooxygenase
MTQMTARLDLHGEHGVDLRDAWRDDDPTAYLGISVPRFPNLFLMLGPNTGLGHGGSAIFQSECQARYITSLAVQMIERGIRSVDVKRAVHDEYVERVDAEHEQLIWTHPGMSTYYRNARGRVFSVMPWRLVDYWKMTHDAELDDYECDGRGATAPRPRAAEGGDRDADPAARRARRDKRAPRPNPPRR